MKISSSWFIWRNNVTWLEMWFVIITKNHIRRKELDWKFARPWTVVSYKYIFRRRVELTMHKIVRSNESSIPSKQRYFSRVEDQNVRFQGAVSSPVNRIWAQFELHTLQFYGIALARTSLDKAISDTKQRRKTERKERELDGTSAAFEWRDPDLSARNRIIGSSRRSFVFNRLRLADIVSASKQTAPK